MNPVIRGIIATGVFAVLTVILFFLQIRQADLRALATKHDMATVSTTVNRIATSTDKLVQAEREKVKRFKELKSGQKKLATDLKRLESAVK